MISALFPTLLTKTLCWEAAHSGEWDTTYIHRHASGQEADAHLYIPESSNWDIARTASFSQQEQAFLGQSYFPYTIVGFNWGG